MHRLLGPVLVAGDSVADLHNDAPVLRREVLVGCFVCEGSSMSAGCPGLRDISLGELTDDLIVGPGRGRSKHGGGWVVAVCRAVVVGVSSELGVSEMLCCVECWFLDVDNSCLCLFGNFGCPARHTTSRIQVQGSGSKNNGVLEVASETGESSSFTLAGPGLRKHSKVVFKGSRA